MNKSIVLICKSIVYFSPEDEALFFDWIGKISCIEKVTGAGDELYLYIHSYRIQYSDLKNLIGLFYRYQVDMTQLAQFLTPENRGWFARRSAPWYYRIFNNKVKKMAKKNSIQ